MLSEANSLQTEMIMRKGLKKCWLMFACHLIGGSCITVHWLSRPILIALIYGEKTRVVDTWPVFIDTWTQFVFSYAFQFPGVVCLGHCFYIFDNVYFCMCKRILIQLEVLRYRLETLNLENTEELKACVRHHDCILRVCHKLRDASTVVIIWQCINTVIMACSGVFIITMMEGISSNVILNLGEIVLIIMITLYGYSWFSNEITLQCSDVLRNAYMSDWTNGSMANKRTLHIMMTRTAQPIYFGGILEITLNTFITVLKTTFSYYNFLTAMTGNEDNGK